jgi:hypothetical protein
MLPRTGQHPCCTIASYTKNVKYFRICIIRRNEVLFKKSLIFCGNDEEIEHETSAFNSNFLINDADYGVSLTNEYFANNGLEAEDSI